MIVSMAVLPMAVMGQTRIKMPKNKYKIQDDVNIGNKAANEVEQQLPILRDRRSTEYIQGVGSNLVRSIPGEFQQPAFRYRFKIVNARDINAFALPGGPMYLNRGMIVAAKNEGEMAGVMAHEISHVALRHGTANATKRSNPLNQILGIGAILGGAVLGGQAGAALGGALYQGFMLQYSRKYETQADVLGARIMADAGYDPRDLANMFRTIGEKSGGSRTPEFLSSHPNPKNRFEKINREATYLRVSENPIKITRGFERIQATFRRMPQAPSMAEIQKRSENNQQGGNPTAGGKYSSRVPYPSSRTVRYRGGNFLSMRVPNNWKLFETKTSVTFAPEGAYGDQGITHGAFVGVAPTNKRGLAQDTQDYVQGVLRGNNYLRQQDGYRRATLDRRQAYATNLLGRSPVTGRNELVSIFTTSLSNGNLFYVVLVVPQREANQYGSAFRNMLNSIDLRD